MPEHYSKNTVSAEAWCKKCQRLTQHRIDHGRRGPCLECLKKLGEVAPAPEPAAEQIGLFER